MSCQRTANVLPTHSQCPANAQPMCLSLAPHLSTLLELDMASASTSFRHERIPFIGANWKQNLTLHQADELAEKMLTLQQTADTSGRVDMVIAPVFLHLERVGRILKSSKCIQTLLKLDLAAQNHSAFHEGAFTGEIAAVQLKNADIHWSILGHSERRHFMHEDNDLLFKKVQRAQEIGMNTIFCVGETEKQREDGKQVKTVTEQLDAIKSAVHDWGKIVIAYEPVWAIGTGKNATPQQAQEMHKTIRQWLEKNVSKEVAEKTRIIYGGSVKASNAAELISQPDIDGFLVGGASLKADEFAMIVNAVSKLSKL